MLHAFIFMIPWAYPVDYIDDLNSRLAYADPSNPYFIEIHEDQFRMGVPLSQARLKAIDSPQFEGKIESCSSPDLYCKKLWVLAFAMPRTPATEGKFHKNVDGVDLNWVSDKKGGFIGTGICGKITKNGCLPRNPNQKPDIKYSYDVNDKNSITSIKLIMSLGDKSESDTIYNLLPRGESLMKISC